MRGVVLGSRWLVAGLALVLTCSCQTAPGPSEPSAPGSSSSSPATAAGVPARPTAQDLLVERTRGPVSSIAATLPLEGVVSGVVIDPVVGEVYITTCRGCGGETPEMADVLQVADIATREMTDEIDLTGEMPGLYPRVAADPYARVLYATRSGGAPSGSISVFDADTHQAAGTIRVGAAGLWGIAVDPTSGLIWVVEEGPSGDSSGILVVIDGASHEVLGRIPVPAEAGAGIAVDPVRGRVLVGDPGEGKLVVVDAASREVARTVQVVPGMDDPCENCLGYLGTPVVDPTTGLVYVSGPQAVGQAPASDALDHPPGTIQSLGVSRGTADVVPVGGGTSAVYVVDPAAGTVIESIVSPAIVLWTRACDQAAGVVYLSTVGAPATGVQALDTETRDLGAVVPIEGETNLAVDPGSGSVWVAGNGAVMILE